MNKKQSKRLKMAASHFGVPKFDSSLNNGKSQLYNNFLKKIKREFYKTPHNKRQKYLQDLENLTENFKSVADFGENVNNDVDNAVDFKQNNV